jgi:hypothetical protein
MAYKATFLGVITTIALIFLICVAANYLGFSPGNDPDQDPWWVPFFLISSLFLVFLFITGIFGYILKNPKTGPVGYKKGALITILMIGFSVVLSLPELLIMLFINGISGIL